MARYDAVVIGVGSAGGSVVEALNSSGMRVAAIERDLIGGLCAYWGCMPSKTLLRPGEIDDEARQAAGVDVPSLDWTQISPYRDYMVRNWDDTAQAERLQRQGVELIRGQATMMGPGRIRTNGRELDTDRVVVATGSEPMIPPVDGLKEAGYWTNREATAFKQVPESVICMGGGAVGCELAQVFRSLGVRITIVEEMNHLLGHESPDASAFLEKALRGRGVELRLGRKVTKVERHDNTRVATLDNGDVLQAEVVLVATGRRASVADLGLERVGIKPGKRGIETDDHCRAGDGVWAVGDVTGVAMFTHVADYQAGIAAADILGHSRPANYADIPRVTYTDPKVAAVGITDPTQALSGMEVVKGQVGLDAIARTETYGKDYEGGLCLFADRREQVLVGAWAVGPLAEEWIAPAIVAIRARIPLTILADVIFPFPTFSEMYPAALEKLREA